MGLTIVEYAEELKPYFRSINVQWLEAGFRVEPIDEAIFADPHRHVLDGGGMIFFVKEGDAVVGTAALMPMGNGDYELAKMGVVPEARGQGIGKQLLEHCLRYAQASGWPRLYLYTSSKLKPALHLYRTHGFVETDFERGGYERSDIKLVPGLCSSLAKFAGCARQY